MSMQTQKVQKIEVKTNISGMPINLMRNGRREKITAIYERWRLVDEWWGETTERDYFRVATSAGIVLDIYRDNISNCWYLGRIHD
ncbi:MAG: hypothetical protein N3E40_01845 [Dehalococcoidia bacterium]|nr:hypothetical protein [Dehalococcoidia bacterium]